MTRARPAVERALYLDPQMNDARLHLMDIAAKERQFARFDTLLGALRTEGPIRLRPRAVLAFATGTPAQRDSALAELRAANDPTVIISAWGTGVYLEQLPDAARIASLLLDGSRPPETQAFARGLLAQLSLGGGRWADAQRQLDLIEPLDPALAIEYRSLLSLAPFAPVSRDSLRSVRDALRRWDATAVAPVAGSTSAIRIHNGVHPLLRLYLLGALSARLADSAGARSAADDLRREAQAPLPARPSLSDSVARAFALDLSHAVDAQAAWQAGRVQDALNAVERIRAESPLERIANSPFYPHLPERFIRAEALHRLGRDREAAGFYTSLQEGRFDAIYLAPTHLRLAEIAERAGDRSAASSHYGRVVELWANADPPMQEIVRGARARIAALARE
jgi:tetratricopeptide (TPR) repeat protein